MNCFSFRCRWHGGQQVPGQRADEGIGPYGDAEGRPFFRGCGGCGRLSVFRGYPKSTVQAVGADALIRPPAQAPMPTRPARSSCAAVGGSAAYGCGVPLAGKAECAEGGTSGTLVTEILGAPQRETGKEELVKCVLAPRPKTHPRRGNPPSNLHRTPPRPSEIRRKPAGTISRQPPHSAEARRCRSAAKHFFFSTGRGAFPF